MIHLQSMNETAHGNHLICDGRFRFYYMNCEIDSAKEASALTGGILRVVASRGLSLCRKYVVHELHIDHGEKLFQADQSYILLYESQFEALVGSGEFLTS